MQKKESFPIGTEQHFVNLFTEIRNYVESLFYRISQIPLIFCHKFQTFDSPSSFSYKMSHTLWMNQFQHCFNFKSDDAIYKSVHFIDQSMRNVKRKRNVIQSFFHFYTIYMRQQVRQSAFVFRVKKILSIKKHMFYYQSFDRPHQE